MLCARYQTAISVISIYMQHIHAALPALSHIPAIPAQMYLVILMLFISLRPLNLQLL